MTPYVDFTGLPQRQKSFNGKNGAKKSILYDGDYYVVKFPKVSGDNPNMHYTNGCVSEYLGSHIFASIGIPVHETLLGTYTEKRKQKEIVACKDFTSSGTVLQDFASIKNQIIDSSGGGYGTELSEILKTISDKEKEGYSGISDRFWNMFIVDALIGNFDRHNGNWGFLYTEATDTLKLAPVFDCGSCLYPQADTSLMVKILYSPSERNKRIYTFPNSVIKENGQKINYYDFLTSHKNKDCDCALARIYPRINMKEIYAIVDDTPNLSDLQRVFYKNMLNERKKKIINVAYEQVKNINTQGDQSDQSVSQWKIKHKHNIER